MFDVWSGDLPFAGLLAALASVFIGSLGIPLPTFALLIFAGSLLAVTSHGIEVGAFMVVFGMTFALIGDIGWFTVGRIYGAKILHFMCRLSLSRDTCARNTAELFARRGLYLLLFSRFLPGLSLVTSPLAGASAVTMPSFVLYDALGAAVWIGVGLTIGFVFAQQIVMVLVVLRHFGLGLSEAALTLVVAYVGYRWFQRRLLIHQLRFARMSVEELNGLIAGHRAPVIVDARSELQQNADPFRIPGARLLQQVALEHTIKHEPKGRPTVVYCACPNEVSAALVVRQMHKRGLRNIHPLAGGIDAWRAAGFPVEPIEPNVALTTARAAEV